MNDKEWQEHMDSCISVVFWRSEYDMGWIFECVYGALRAQVLWHRVNTIVGGAVYLVHTGDELAPALPTTVEEQIAKKVMGNSNLWPRGTER